MMLPDRIAVLRAVADVAHKQRAQVSPLFLLEALDEIERLKRIVSAQDRITEDRYTLTDKGREFLRAAK